MLYVAAAIVAVAGIAWFLIRKASSLSSAPSGPKDAAWCSYCDRPEREAGTLVTGPWLRFAGRDDGVQVFLCGGCIATLEEAFAMEVDESGERSADGPHCSHCNKGHTEVARMALGARYYLVKGDGPPRIERVVQHALFMMAYGEKEPELLLELFICDACTAVAKQALAET